MYNFSATILGMPANLAKDAVSLSPKRVLLKARAWFALYILAGAGARPWRLIHIVFLGNCVEARRTFKAILSMPKMVPAPSSLGVVSVDDGGELVPGVGTKRSTDAARDDGAKRPRVERAEVD